VHGGGEEGWGNVWVGRGTASLLLGCLVQEAGCEVWMWEETLPSPQRLSLPTSMPMCWPSLM
jgi:hypothetical protein